MSCAVPTVLILLVLCRELGVVASHLVVCCSSRLELFLGTGSAGQVLGQHDLERDTESTSCAPAHQLVRWRSTWTCVLIERLSALRPMWVSF